MSSERAVLKDGDNIITAWPTNEAGPGWTNHPVWILVRSTSGALRIECIQPEQQSALMIDVFRICASAHLLMLNEAQKVTRRSR